ncbi:Mycobacterium rhizamassiliense ORFan [Mycobacterium rhizamassiliense]|jgi:hypothetical protein|uniref:Mycobacterium rhizamassiliense ORFan n=1 Tax=Mycobacterium rhizamassiliense TaxID=1841860 RepID=A0A2U3NL20_9MYCO|nr:hypothetical protein [Mycobacterium rhizamassiliense]SPM32237.1 Mycobacterium rhizamassiliense ORFan [Mycobacterium rhizamassiliense]
MPHIAPPAFVNLPALLSSVSDQTLLADPALRALVVEHSCYELHLADWYARQPPRRHCEFNDWIIEGRGLLDGLDELKKTVYGYLRRETDAQSALGNARKNGRPS